MATSVQIVFDCADPDLLGKFWAGALHYKTQDPPSGFVSWEAFLKAQGVPEDEWNTAYAIVDPEKVGPRIYFQKMDTPKPTKNRVHLDLNVSGGRSVPLDERVRRITAEVERILRLGATKQRVWNEADGGYFVVMLDPEGNEFCIQ
jgi:hypothetical protein